MQGAGGAAVGGDTELVSRQLQLEQKLYYLDLKDNNRGRFLKISERTNSSRNTIIVPLNGIVWFVDLFNYYANGDDAELSSKELQLETKVFYFDVGENPRGRYLKVSEAQVPRSSYNRSSIIVPAGQTRDEGWAAFRNVLVEIHEASLTLLPHPATTAAALQGNAGLAAAVTSGAGGLPLPQSGAPAQAGAPAPSTLAQAGGVAPSFLPEGAAGAAVAEQAGTAGAGATVGGITGQMGSLAVAPAGAAGNGAVGAGEVGAGQVPPATASRVIRAEQKKFFLDLGANNRGHFLKISEVLGSVRSAIILPASALEELHDAVGQFLEVLRKQGSIQPGASHVHVRNVPSLPKQSADGEAVGS